MRVSAPACAAIVAAQADLAQVQAGIAERPAKHGSHGRLADMAPVWHEHAASDRSLAFPN
jgi:hypothetical protein